MLTLVHPNHRLIPNLFSGSTKERPTTASNLGQNPGVEAPSRNQALYRAALGGPSTIHRFGRYAIFDLSAEVASCNPNVIWPWLAGGDAHRRTDPCPACPGNSKPRAQFEICDGPRCLPQAGFPRKRCFGVTPSVLPGPGASVNSVHPGSGES
jgi:hypothetical protein